MALVTLARHVERYMVPFRMKNCILPDGRLECYIQCDGAKETATAADQKTAEELAAIKVLNRLNIHIPIAKLQPNLIKLIAGDDELNEDLSSTTIGVSTVLHPSASSRTQSTPPPSRMPPADKNSGFSGLHSPPAVSGAHKNDETPNKMFKQHLLQQAIETHLNRSTLIRNPIGMLQEFWQHLPSELLVTRPEYKKGESTTSLGFVMQCCFLDLSSTGSACTMKGAKTQAAENMLKMIKQIVKEPTVLSSSTSTPSNHESSQLAERDNRAPAPGIDAGINAVEKPDENVLPANEKVEFNNRVLWRMIKPFPELSSQNPVSSLQEIVQKMGSEPPRYDFTQQYVGVAPVFTCVGHVPLFQDLSATGIGPSKSLAKRHVACALYERLKDEKKLETLWNSRMNNDSGSKI